MACFIKNLMHAKVSLVATAFAVVTVLAGCSTQKSANTISQATLMQWEDSINNIIGKMTLEEKVEMLHGKNMFSSAGVPRLGIADIEYADGPFGIREEMEPHGWNTAGLTTDSATYFPTGSALAATWSNEMAYEYGKASCSCCRIHTRDAGTG